VPYDDENRYSILRQQAYDLRAASRRAIAEAQAERERARQIKQELRAIRQNLAGRRDVKEE
jgi:hypothetical protein